LPNILHLDHIYISAFIILVDNKFNKTRVRRFSPILHLDFHTGLTPMIFDNKY